MICYEGTNVNCYYLANGNSQTGCTPLTEEQMTMDFMYIGFDFDNVWYIDENSDYPYPQLRIPNTKTVEKITIKTLPRKTVYISNETIEATNGILNVKYIDGTYEDVPMKTDMLSNYDMSVAGAQAVTVTYEGKTATFDIQVKDEANISNVSVYTQPNKTQFVKGTKFDFSGCVVRVEYTDTTYDDIEIKPEMTTGGDINTVGQQTISYTIGGHTVSFDVEVVPVALDRIFVASAPDKVDYLPDEDFDDTGLVVKAEYNNGKVKTITNYTLSGFGNENEVNPITVSYDEKTTIFNVTIHTPDEEWTTVTEASCTVQGKKVKYCKTCGNVVISEVVEPKGHTSVIDNAVAPTCTKAGLTEGSHCSVCGVVLTAQNDVNAKGHNYTSKITTPATCSNKGIRTYTCSTCNDTYTVELAMTEHTPTTDAAIAPTCTATGLTEGSHCSVCGKVLTAQEVVNANGHTYVATTTAPTCKEQGYTTYTCSVCGDSYKADYIETTTTHDYKSTITTPATCTTKGVKTFTCSICGDKYTEAIDMIAHTPETDEAVAPTCTATGLTEGSHCSVCGKVLTAQEVVNANGHTYIAVVTAPTCKDQGYTTYTCSVCGDSYKSDYIETTATHDYKSTITTPATCTTKGVKTFTCSICGDKYTEDVAMLDHTPETDEAVAPTCTAAGLTEGSHCSVCGKVLTSQEVVNANGHTYVATTTAPTCKDQGYTTYTCSVCGDSYKTDYTETITTHDYKAVITTPATCNTDGVKTFTCSICGDSYTEKIDKTGVHSYSSAVTTPATCTTKGVKTFTCSICGDKYTEDVAMLDHTPETDEAVSPTCTKTGLTEGSHCSVCGTVISSQTEVAALGHNYVAVVTAPTCRDKGYTTYTCSRCGDSYRTDYTDTTNAHDYKGVVTKQPTCTSEGVKTFTCSVCGDTYDESIKKIAHTPAEAVEENRVEATCTAKGSYDSVVYCTECNSELSRESIEIDIVPHTIVTDDAVVPTCTATGLTEGSHCSACGEVFIAQEVVEALGHTWNDGEVTKKSTPTAEGVKTYTCTVCGDKRTEAIAKCAKYANPITAKGKTVTVKFANLSKKSQTVAQKNAFTISKAQGKVTYKKSSGNKNITVSSAGKVTVKKGLKKGTYKIKVKVTAAGNATYKAKTVTVTVTIKVK